MANKPIDRLEIIRKLNEGSMLYSHWSRCLRARIGYKCHSILITIIESGQRCFLSTNKFLIILGMNPRTFRTHRQELIDLGAISYKKGHSSGMANEYTRSNEMISLLIEEGQSILSKNDVPSCENIHNLPTKKPIAKSPSFKISQIN